MRIVSQNGTFDVNYNDVALWVVPDSKDYDEGKYRIQCTYRGEVFDLGIYENEDRALEVINEIRDDYVQIKQSEFFGKEDALFYSRIYFMPEE